jgi:nucleoid-associated protein YgaU
MNRKYSIVLSFVLLGIFLPVPVLLARPLAESSSASLHEESVPSGTSLSEIGPDTATAQAAAPPQAQSPARLPRNLLDNEYYRESVRLTALAQETYDYGDYDLAREYAEEAERNARLSDAYIALQLKIAEADEAIAVAELRIQWALGVRADRRYPEEFAQATASRDNAAASRDAEDWDAAILAAHQAIDALAFVEDFPGILPAQYQVRSWPAFRDCLWTIAGRSWVYGDSRLWRHLYDANRSKLPNPDNPDMLLPGTILDIPSIKNEVREGLWDENIDYPSFN